MPLNNLIGAHWTLHSRQHLRQILHRVPTHANIADPFSREDFSIAQQLGWHILEPPTKKILSTTQKIIGDSKYAHNTGFSDNQFIHQFQNLAYNKLLHHSHNNEQTDNWWSSVLVTLDHSDVVIQNFDP